MYISNVRPFTMRYAIYEFPFTAIVKKPPSTWATTRPVRVYCVRIIHAGRTGLLEKEIMIVCKRRDPLSLYNTSYKLYKSRNSRKHYYAPQRGNLTCGDGQVYVFMRVYPPFGKRDKGGGARTPIKTTGFRGGTSSHISRKKRMYVFQRDFCLWTFSTDGGRTHTERGVLHREILFVACPSRRWQDGRPRGLFNVSGITSLRVIPFFFCFFFFFSNPRFFFFSTPKDYVCQWFPPGAKPVIIDFVFRLIYLRKPSSCVYILSPVDLATSPPRSPQETKSHYPPYYLFRI